MGKPSRAHDPNCEKSTAPKKDCKCTTCNKRLHGIAAPPPAAQSARTRQGKGGGGGAAGGVAIAVTAAVVLGAWTVTASASSSSGSSLSVQVKVDLNQALAGLAAAGFGKVRNSTSSASGPSYQTSCANSATKEVRQFLERYPCKQYAVATRTVTGQAITAEVAFSWVEMPTTSQADQYKAKVDEPGTGNSPGVPLAFGGTCDASGQQKGTVWTVFVKPTGKAGVDREVLRAAAPSQLSSSYLKQHCIN
jgi:hypothetical protein